MCLVWILETYCGLFMLQSFGNTKKEDMVSLHQFLVHNCKADVGSTEEAVQEKLVVQHVNSRTNLRSKIALWVLVLDQDPIEKDYALSILAEEETMLSVWPNSLQSWVSGFISCLEHIPKCMLILRHMNSHEISRKMILELRSAQAMMIMLLCKLSLPEKMSIVTKSNPSVYKNATSWHQAPSRRNQSHTESKERRWEKMNNSGEYDSDPCSVIILARIDWSW